MLSPNLANTCEDQNSSQFPVNFVTFLRTPFLAEQLQVTVSGSAHVFLLRHLYEIIYNQNLQNSEKEV